MKTKETKNQTILTSVARLVGHRPMQRNVTSWSQARAQAWVVGLVPSWGACERQLSDVSLTRGCFSLFLPPSPPSEDKWIQS